MVGRDDHGRAIAQGVEFSQVKAAGTHGHQQAQITPEHKGHEPAADPLAQNTRQQRA